MRLNRVTKQNKTKMSVDFYKENSKNENTTHATNSWYRNYCSWAEKTGTTLEISAVSKVELNRILEVYFAESLKKNGKHFEPSSLLNMQAGINRNLGVR